MTFDDLTRPLAAADVPLLKDDPELDRLLREYNQAANTLREIRNRRPAALELPDVQKPLETLASLHASLTRRRYLMGFLGTSQAGKSSTFNRVLNLANDADPPATSGTGAATTSAITRLFAKPLGEEPDVTLFYLTAEEYRRRREALCTRINFQNAKDRTDEELFDLLARPAPAGDKAGFTVFPADRPFLRQFVRSHMEYGGEFVRPARPYARKESYSRRAEFLNHKDQDAGRGDPPPNPNLLIAEALIGYPTQEIAPELEMVDCPGLGSKRTVDTVLTKDYIQRLDGALLFLKAEHVDSGDVNEILEELKTRFPHGLQGRVWVVVNKFDVPTRQAKLIGDHKKLTTFDQIANLLGEKGIPLTQVCLTCNNIFDEAHGSGGTIGRAEALAMIGLKPDDEHHETLQRLRRDMPELADAFGHLVEDGGISHLRRLVKETVARNVAEKIRADALTELLHLNGKLRRTLEIVTNPVDEKQIADAESCWRRLQLMLDRLNRRNRYFDPLADQLKGDLTRLLFDNKEHEALIRKGNRKFLEDQFELHARRLDRSLHSAVEAAVQKVYEQLMEDLADLPTVRLADFEQGVRQALIQFQSDDTSRRDWRIGFPTFAEPGLVTDLQLTGAEYLEVVREKIRTAVFHALHLLRLRVKERLTDLADQTRTVIFQGIDGGARPAGRGA